MTSQQSIGSLGGSTSADNLTRSSLQPSLRCAKNLGLRLDPSCPSRGRTTRALASGLSKGSRSLERACDEGLCAVPAWVVCLQVLEGWGPLAGISRDARLNLFRNCKNTESILKEAAFDALFGGTFTPKAKIGVTLGFPCSTYRTCELLKHLMEFLNPRAGLVAVGDVGPERH